VNSGLVWQKECLGREKEIEIYQTFLEQSLQLSDGKTRLLNFHGVGGIGKSTLCNKLMVNDSYTEHFVTALLDYHFDHYHDKHETLHALSSIFRGKLAGLHFTSYQFAYAVYWKKVFPNKPLTEVVAENFVEETDFTLSVLKDVLTDVQELTGLAYLPKTINFFKKHSARVREWWEVRGNKLLKELEKKTGREIEEMLPKIWADDLRTHLKKSYKTPIIFIDTHEKLIEKSRKFSISRNHDNWLENLVTLLPEVIFVIFGREPITWRTTDQIILTQYEIEGLPEPDAKKLLELHGINDPTIQDLMIQHTQSHPYYLELAIQTYLDKPERFTKEWIRSEIITQRNEVVRRFLEYMDEQEYDTIVLLSIPYYWDEELYTDLLSAFPTGYGTLAMDRLARYAYITYNDQQHEYEMYQLMREELHTNIQERKPTYYQKVNLFLFNYYKIKQANILSQFPSSKQMNKLYEMFDYAKKAKVEKEFLIWFLAETSSLSRNANGSILLQKLEPFMIELASIQPIETDAEYVNAYIELISKICECTLQTRNNGKLDHYLQVLSHYIQMSEQNHFFDSQHQLTLNANYLALLGISFENKGQSESAIQHFDLALSQLPDDHHLRSILYRRLGHLYSVNGDYEKLQQLAQSQQNYAEKYELDFDGTLSMKLNLADAYKVYQKFDQAIPILQSAIEDANHVLGETSLEVQRLKLDLADAYYLHKQNEQALAMYNAILDSFKTSYGDESIQVIVLLRRIAKVETNNTVITNTYMAALQIAENLLANEADQDWDRMADGNEEVGRIYYELGLLNHDSRKYRRAIRHFKRALDYRIENLETEGNLISYYHYLIDLHSMLNEEEKVLLYFKQALEIMKKTDAFMLEQLEIFNKGIEPYTKEKYRTNDEILSILTLNIDKIIKVYGIDGSESLGKSYLNLGALYLNSKNSQEAIPPLQQALLIYEKFQNELGIGMSWALLSLAYMDEQKDPTTVANNLEKAISHLEKWQKTSTTKIEANHLITLDNVQYVASTYIPGKKGQRIKSKLDQLIHRLKH
jgi:tetratricopeptide (TPR) repeat protein